MWLWTAMWACSEPASGVSEPLPPVPAAAAPDACPPLEAGTRRGQVFPFGGVDRVYTVHVPEGIDGCAPVVVDLHGAYGGPRPEQAYAEAEAIAAADAFGVVLIRPRGLAVDRYGTTVYYWNYPDMLQTNADFVEALADFVAPNARQRLLRGNSRGADLTGWVLADQRDWDAFGLIAGAAWSVTRWPRFSEAAPPVYTQVGSKDDLASHDAMIAALDAAGHPADARWVDAGAGGHRLAAMHYARLLPWWLDGERPDPSIADPAWTQEAWTAADLLAIDPSDARLRVGDAAGQVWADGEATEAASGPIRGLCGPWTAVYGDLTLAPGTDPLPTSGTGYAFAHHVACAGDLAVAVGDKLYARDGDSWAAAAMGLEWFGSATDGTDALAVGRYNQVARLAGGRWTVTSVGGAERWLYGAAIDGDTRWVVGESGLIARQVGDGRWEELPSLIDLPWYAVDARGGRVVVVGHDGWLARSDDGETFTLDPVPARFLADVRLTDDTIEAVGADGAVWRRPWP